MPAAKKTTKKSASKTPAKAAKKAPLTNASIAQVYGLVIFVVATLAFIVGLVLGADTAQAPAAFK